MNSIFSTTPALCDFPDPTWLLFSDNVAPLVHYSHIPITIISLILGCYIFFKDRKSLPNKILFCLTLAFSAWVFLDSVFWATNRSDVIMFVWSLQILFEPIVYISAFYLLNVLITKQDISFGKKVIIALGYLPIILLVPTGYSLMAFDIPTCLSVESSLIIYLSYGFEIFITLWIIYFSIVEFWKAKTGAAKDQILYLTIGTILLLMAFSSGNIISSFTEDWRFAQIGLLTMPVFIGYLVYSIVKLHTFNIKLIGTQALVVALWILVPSMLFVQDIYNIKLIVGGTSILIIILGASLIRSVKREVEQRERIEILAKELEVANEKLKALDQARAEFISIASHQLRTPPATVKWYLSALLAGDYGKVPDGVMEQLRKTQNTNNHLISLIEDMLNVSRIERGKMEFLFALSDIEDLAKFAYEQLIPMSQDKKLTLTYTAPAKPLPKIMADSEKIRQVMNNLIDNALKYSKVGSVNVALTTDGKNIIFKVKDSGKGIEPQEQHGIFEKFSRGKESVKQSAGLGLGLYVAKIIIEQHKGKIWAESPGRDKGSTFAFSLPINSGLKETTLLDLSKTK